MTTTTKPTVTTSSFVRSHQRQPRGYGGWAFQQSSSSDAFDADLRGDILFVSGTYTEARTAAVAHFAGAEFVAVLP